MTDKIPSSTVRYLPIISWICVSLVCIVSLPSALLAQTSSLSDFGSAVEEALRSNGGGLNLGEIAIGSNAADSSNADVAALGAAGDSFQTLIGSGSMFSSSGILPNVLQYTAVGATAPQLVAAEGAVNQAERSIREKAAAIQQRIEQRSDIAGILEDCVSTTGAQYPEAPEEQLLIHCYDTYVLNGESGDGSQVNTDEIAVVGTIARDGTEICTSHILAAEIRELEELDDGSNPAMAKQIEQLKSDLANIKKYVGDCCRQFLGGGGIPGGPSVTVGDFANGVGGAGGGTPRLLLECKPPEIVDEGEGQNQGAVGGAFTRELIKQLLTDMTDLYRKRCDCEAKVFVAANHDPFSGEAVCAGDQLQRQINQNVGNTSVMNIPFYSNPEVQEWISRLTVTGRVEPLPVHECIWENKIRSLLRNANDNDTGVVGAVTNLVNGGAQNIIVNGQNTLVSAGVQAALGGGNVGSAIGGAAGGLICQMGGPRLSCDALASLIPSTSEIDAMADTNGMSSSGNPIKFYLFLYARTAAFYKAVSLYTGFVGRLQQLNPYGVKSKQALLGTLEKQFLSALAIDGNNFNSIPEAVNAFDKRNLRQFWIWTNQITTACKVGGNESDVPPDQGSLPAL